jgi:alpha-tubulin suppressor-like RCC1 family protein
VFTWGDGECGQLGLGDDRSNKLVPALVRGEVLNKAVVQVAVGNDHSMCVAEDGSVYSWGRNGEGQLGVVTARLTGVDFGAPLPMLVQELDINATE